LGWVFFVTSKRPDISENWFGREILALPAGNSGSTLFVRFVLDEATESISATRMRQLTAAP
jgi:hypothetical protein